MSDFCCLPGKTLKGVVTVPGDKSISHRFVIFSALADGTSRAHNFLTGEDCLSTVEAFRKMGVSVTVSGTECEVIGVGKYGLKAPDGPLYVGNSGTTIRLLAGLLAGQRFDTVLAGDDSLSKRPMDRVIIPLRTMNADISGIGEKNHPPLTVKGRVLKGSVHHERLGSAQVKSALLLAGLYAEGRTIVVEKKRSRDHTERMFDLFGAEFNRDADTLTIFGSSTFKAVQDFVIPGDISSAAFFIVAGLIIPGSDIVLKDVCLNPTRSGIIEVLRQMGAKIDVSEKKGRGEPCGDIRVKHSKLHGVTVADNLLPFLIDEVPILMVACSLAEGRSCIKNASELRVKETDRIMSMTEGLTALGADIKVDGDTLHINGAQEIKGGAEVRSFSDHRTAMSLIVAGLAAQEKVTVKDIECIDISYPKFVQDLNKCLKG
jgi:3-phosphoshikimate 1-carboxyvinyltransferase